MEGEGTHHRRTCDLKDSSYIYNPVSPYDEIAYDHMVYLYSANDEELLLD